MEMVALNVYVNGGSECLCKWWLCSPMKMMALNAYVSGGFERQTENGGSGRQTKMVALNA